MWKKLSVAVGALAAFIAVLLLRGIGSQVGKEVGSALTIPSRATPEQIQAKLLEVANKLNQRSPFMADEDTRMDNAAVGPGYRITYHYTLVKFSSRDLSQSSLRESLFPSVRAGVCTSKEMAPSLRLGVAYVYSYFGSDGIKIGDLEVNNNVCNSKEEVVTAAPTFTSQGWTEEDTKLDIIDPFEKYAPPSGTRYYRNYQGIIFRVYPPGARPDLPAANPFGLDGSKVAVPPR